MGSSFKIIEQFELVLESYCVTFKEVNDKYGIYHHKSIYTQKNTQKILKFLTWEVSFS